MHDNGQVAVVTGASRGIGEAVTTSLLEAGYRTVGLARSWKDEQTSSDELRLCCDVTDQHQVETAFDRLEEVYGGPATVLVNNAGLTCDGLFATTRDTDWEAMLATNLTGTMRIMRRAIRGMIRVRYGRIVNVGSVTGTMGNAGQASYAASKSGLVGLTKAVAREIASRNITVNLVAPGLVETEMTATMPSRAKFAVLAATPVGRMGTPAEVAAAIRFLVSPEASYITGAVLAVDGGLS